MNFPLFLIPILSGLAAQILKPFLNKGWHAELETAGRKIPRYGGMPSAHTAFAFSLATVVAVVDGVFTTSFAIVASLVIFVLDDALRMRIFLGRHGKALRLLVEKLPPQEREGFPYLESHLGHKPMEVVVGAILGITVTLLALLFL